MWFFRREQYLKVFGAVFEGCLLIYKSEKSKKPVFSLNLITYRGQELINSKRRGSFEVTDKIKSYNVSGFIDLKTCCCCCILNIYF